jgi:glycosyltransferase involved in cell wall biosynthesis
MIWQFIDSGSVGGAERHVASVAQALTRLGLPVRILLYEDHGRNPWLEQLTTAKLESVVLGGSFTGLVRRLALGDCQLLHTHGYKAGVLGRLAARLTCTPVVSTFHSGERGSFPVGFYDWLDEWTSFLGERIAVSTAIQGRLPFSATHIRNFVSAPRLAPTECLPRRVAFVGRLSEEKEPEMFCTLARLSPPGLEWHVWGDGPLRARLEYEHAGSVCFRGITTNMETVWPAIGLLVIPSRYEGLPLVALEAQAAGIPVLASRVGDIPLAVRHGETGWLFQNLREAQAHLASWCALRESEQLVLRRSCWSHVRDNFSQEVELPKLLEVYARAGLEVPEGFGGAF